MSPITMMTPDTSLVFTSTVVIAGIGIVLGVLILLILVFFAFGKIVSTAESKARAKAQKKAQKSSAQISAPVQAVPKPSAPSVAPVVEQGISNEVVAVITGAIVASEGTGVTVRSIKKVNVSGRNPWASAGVADNTRPF